MAAISFSLPLNNAAGTKLSVNKNTCAPPDLDLHTNNGNLYFAPTDDPENLIELTYKNNNFGFELNDYYQAVAIEVIKEPTIGEEYIGKHIVLVGDQRDELYNYLDGFVFDENGKFIGVEPTMGRPPRGAASPHRSRPPRQPWRCGRSPSGRSRQRSGPG